MNNERILPYQLSRKISKDDLDGISAAGATVTATSQVTYAPTAFDTILDVEYDQ